MPRTRITTRCLASFWFSRTRLRLSRSTPLTPAVKTAAMMAMKTMV